MAAAGAARRHRCQAGGAGDGRSSRYTAPAGKASAFARPLLGSSRELTIYDASYVALAEAMGVTLLTGDRRLARATGLRCHIEVIQ